MMLIYVNNSDIGGMICVICFMRCLIASSTMSVVPSKLYIKGVFLGYRRWEMSFVVAYGLDRKFFRI